MTSRHSIYAVIPLVYRPEIGERVRFWTGRGSHGYATVRAVRFHPRLQCELFLLNPESDAHKGADYWHRGGQPYWGPRDFGVCLEQLDQEPQIWFENF